MTYNMCYIIYDITQNMCVCVSRYATCLSHNALFTCFTLITYIMRCQRKSLILCMLYVFCVVFYYWHNVCNNVQLNVQRTQRTTHTNDWTYNMKTKNVENVVKTTKKTFTLAQLARDCELNEKIVRSRFRRYFKNDDEKYNVVRQTCVNAKSRWVYPIALYDAIRDVVKRDDDE